MNLYKNNQQNEDFDDDENYNKLWVCWINYIVLHSDPTNCLSPYLVMYKVSDSPYRRYKVSKYGRFKSVS